MNGHFIRRILRRIRQDAGLAFDLLQDQRLGIKTGSPLRQAVKPDERTSPYEPISYQALSMIQARLSPGPGAVFYDIGCGLGRALCYFARSNVARCIGVELDPALADAARVNAARMKGRKAGIEIIQGDAARQDYAGGTLFFLYNPFSAEVMKPVLERIHETSAGQDIQLCYANPVAADCLDAMPWLAGGVSFMVPYRGGAMRVGVWQTGGSGASSRRV